MSVLRCVQGKLLIGDMKGGEGVGERGFRSCREGKIKNGVRTFKGG